MPLSTIEGSWGAVVGVSDVRGELTEEQWAQARFTGLLEAAPDAMVCVDGQGRIALVNAQAERLFGYGRGELVGQPGEVLVPDAGRGGHPGERGGAAGEPPPRALGAEQQQAR